MMDVSSPAPEPQYISGTLRVHLSDANALMTTRYVDHVILMILISAVQVFEISDRNEYRVHSVLEKSLKIIDF